jgi:hypothetical protein
MDHPTTTAAALAIAALLAVVAARYYRRSRALQRQIDILQGEMHLQHQTLTQAESARDASLRALNEVLLANSQRPVSIMRFNGVDYARYNVKAYYRN